MSFIMFFAYWQVPYALGRLDRYLFRLLKSPKFLGQCLTHSRFSVNISWISWTNKRMLPETGALLLIEKQGSRERKGFVQGHLERWWQSQDQNNYPWPLSSTPQYWSTVTVSLELCPSPQGVGSTGKTVLTSQHCWPLSPGSMAFPSSAPQQSLGLSSASLLTSF